MRFLQNYSSFVHDLHLKVLSNLIERTSQTVTNIITENLVYVEFQLKEIVLILLTIFTLIHRST